MLKLEDASFRYEGAGADAVHGVSLGVMAFERVCILGANGSGKSTLARLAAGALKPRAGTVSVDGEDLAGSPRRDIAFVGQDPLSQIVGSTVAEDVAFGPRAQGLPRAEVLSRTAEALGACGLARMEGRPIQELSGGQQQRVALAAALAMRPRFLVLDEVCSQLDQEARESVRAIVTAAQEAGCGVLEVTHSFEDVMGASRVIALHDGVAVWRGTPSDLIADEGALALCGLSRDPIVRVGRLLLGRGYRVGQARDVDEVARYARLLGLRGEVAAMLDGLWDAAREEAAAHEGAAEGPRLREAGWMPDSLAFDGVSVSYDGEAALSEVSFEVAPGEVCLVSGRTGSGKSTLASVAAGVLEPDAGSAMLDGAPVRPGRVGLAFQRPEDQLFCDSVFADVAYGPRNIGLREDAVDKRAHMAIRALGIDESLVGTSPFKLSGGQRRRVALAGIVALAPAAYVLDEPTAGLDGAGRAFLHGLVRALAAAGAPVIIVSHDVGEWLPLADKVALLGAGCLAACAPATELRADSAPFERAGMRAPFAVRLREALDADE